MNTLVLKNIDDEELKIGWKKLADLDKYNNNPFVNYDRIFAWYKCNQETKKYDFECFVVYERDEIIGIIPLAVRIVKHVIKIAYFAGSDYNDYNDIIVADGYEKVVTRLFFNQYGVKYFLVMRGLREDSAIYKAILQIRPFIVQKTTISPYCMICAGNELRKSTKKDILYNIRRMNSTGSLSLVQIADSTKRALALDLLTKMHKKEWHEKNKKSIFEVDEVNKYYRNLIHYVNDESSYIFALRYNEIDIAYVLGQKKGETIFYYKPTYDPDYKKYSPGKILIWYIREYWESSGGKVIDFLVGDEDYKFDWCNDSISIYSAYFVKPVLLNKLFFSMMKMHDEKNGKVYREQKRENDEDN